MTGAALWSGGGPRAALLWGGVGYRPPLAGGGTGDAAIMLAGFESRYPLTDLERRLLPTLIAARLVCSCVCGAYSAAQDPANKAGGRSDSRYHSRARISPTAVFTCHSRARFTLLKKVLTHGFERRLVSNS